MRGLSATTFREVYMRLEQIVLLTHPIVSTSLPMKVVKSHVHEHVKVRQRPGQTTT